MSDTLSIRPSEPRLRALPDRAFDAEVHRLVVENAPLAIVVLDAPTSKITFANDYAAGLHGFKGPHEMVGIDGLDLVPFEFRQCALDSFAETVQKGRASGMLHHLLRADGSTFRVEAAAAVIRDEAGRPHSVINLYQDVTERLASQEQLEHQALHDPLTDLPNRTLLKDRLEQALLSAHRTNTEAAVLMIDLDRFKEVNDALGHEVGDDMLIAAGRRFRNALRSDDTMARFGGDEFAVVLSGADADGAASIARRLLSTLDEPFQSGDHSVYLDARIGVATFPDDAQDAKTLLRRADVAMYSAKNSSLGIGVYSQTNDPHREEQLTLAAELRAAIANREFELHYQPQVSLESGEVSGVEALIRWRHPQRGLVLPAGFLPLAEKTGQIAALTDWVLDEALRQTSEWHKQGMVLQTAINISTWSVRDPGFGETVRLAREKWGAELCNLTLEVTETGLMSDPIKSLAVLKTLAASGVSLAIDDFGTGYSSLAYLDQLPAHDLKIDRVFVRDLDTDEKHRRIVQGTIALAHDLGLRVIAEGVESRKVQKLLASYGCDFVQGHWISEPLGACEMTRWLRRRTSRVGSPPGTAA